jgi:uncharacterized protein (TIGR02598 family)
MRYLSRHHRRSEAALEINFNRRSSAAFSLIEVTLAMGVTTFCLMTLFSLLPVGIKNNQVATSDTAAASLSREVVIDLRNTPSSASGNTYATSPLFAFQIPNAGQSATVSSPQTVFLSEAGTTTTPSSAHYRITIAFTPPTSGLHCATTVRILVSWPALADPKPSVWPSNYMGSYETLTALDRN